MAHAPGPAGDTHTARTNQTQGSEAPAPPLADVPASALPPGVPTTHVGKYTLYETIGEGAFGKVKLGLNRSTQEKVAVKIMDKKEILEQELSTQVRREIYIMRSLRHRHIVRMFEVLTSETKLYIVMELVTGGELFERLEQHGRVDESLARHYFQQLIDGVAFCHKNGVAHRDLKPENLLLDENGDIKITDFGFSSMRSVDVNADLLYTQCGTPDYCAPEIIERAEEGYNGAKVDVWSCGIILYALLVGTLPFLEQETDRLYDLILACQVNYPDFLSDSVRDLLQNLLVRNPAKRYSLAEVKRHPWFLVDYTGDDARVLKKPAFYKKSNSSNGTATTADSGVARTGSNGQQPKNSSTSRELGDGKKHSRTSADAKETLANTTFSTSAAPSNERRNAYENPANRAVHHEPQPLSGTSNEVTSAAGGSPENHGLALPSSAPNSLTAEDPRISDHHRGTEAVLSPALPRGSAGHGSYEESITHNATSSGQDHASGALQSGVESGRVSALIKMREMAESSNSLDPKNPPPSAVFTPVQDRPATPSRGRVETVSQSGPAPPALKQRMYSHNDPRSGTSSGAQAQRYSLDQASDATLLAGKTAFEGSTHRGSEAVVDVRTRDSSERPGGEERSRAFAAASQVGTPHRGSGQPAIVTPPRPSSVPVSTRLNGALPPGVSRRHEELGRFEDELPGQPGALGLGDMPLRSALGGSTSSAQAAIADDDDDDDVEDYRSKPVPALRLPVSERFMRHQTAQELRNGRIGEPLAPRHRSDAGVQAANLAQTRGNRASLHAQGQGSLSTQLQGLGVAGAHGLGMRSASPSAASMVDGYSSRAGSPFRRGMPGSAASSGGSSGQVDGRGSVLANRSLRASPGLPQQHRLSTPSSPTGLPTGPHAYNTGAVGGPGGVSAGSWHDGGSSMSGAAAAAVAATAAAARSSSDELPYRTRGSGSGSDATWFGPHSEQLSRRMWNMFARWRSVVEEPVSPHSSQELRMEYRSILAEVNSVMDVEEKLAVYQQFMTLFGKHGLGDITAGRAEKIDSGGEYERGGASLRRSPTDLSSDDDGATWSPTVGGGERSKSDLTRRREMSDLLTRWIRKYSAGSGAQASREDSIDDTYGSEDGGFSMDIVELQRLMRQHQSGRDDSNLAEELDRLMRNPENAAAFREGGGLPPASVNRRSQSYDQYGAPLQATAQWDSSAPGDGVPGPAGSGAGLDSVGVDGSGSSRKLGAQEYGAASLNSGDRTNGSGSSGIPPSGAGGLGAGSGSSSGLVGDQSGAGLLRTQLSSGDPGVSLGLDDVEYYGSDRRGVSSKIRGVLYQMKAKNQRLVEAETWFTSSQEPDLILKILMSILTTMGAHVAVKKETKRKLKVKLPLGEERVLHAAIELTVSEDGLSKVSFKRSRADRGRTNTLAFQEFFESVREQFIAEVQARAMESRRNRTGASARRNRAKVAVAVGLGVAGPSGVDAGANGPSTQPLPPLPGATRQAAFDGPSSLYLHDMQDHGPHLASLQHQMGRPRTTQAHRVLGVPAGRIAPRAVSDMQ